MPTEPCQLYGRFPQPFRRSGSIVVPALVVPKLGSAIAPHSPFATGLSRSHCGTKSRFASFHDRVVLVTRRAPGAISWVTATRSPDPSATCFRYLLKLALSAVLPSPNRSYAMPKRGDTSCHRRPLLSGN